MVSDFRFLGIVCSCIRSKVRGGFPHIWGVLPSQLKPHSHVTATFNALVTAYTATYEPPRHELYSCKDNHPQMQGQFLPLPCLAGLTGTGGCCLKWHTLQRAEARASPSGNWTLPRQSAPAQGNSTEAWGAAGFLLGGGLLVKLTL